MHELWVIDDPAVASVSLDPVRLRLLAELVEPRSATSLAGRIGLPRQKVNYHLRTLEQHGLVGLVQLRRRGNMTERVMQATAASYVISPAALGAAAPDPSRSPDRLSARWLIAVATRTVREVGELMAGATRASKRLATFALDGEVRFASAAARAAFAEELGAAVTELVGKYHDDNAPGGRPYRIVIAVHPNLEKEER
ncbi:MAG TPA: helix-turn-helix domain-containing protein [Dermatophilaceae bacterium]|nr:helix-turn-helix domain-containing protein [Dermatophilaceae bacterium]